MRNYICYATKVLLQPRWTCPAETANIFLQNERFKSQSTVWSLDNGIMFVSLSRPQFPQKSGSKFYLCSWPTAAAAAVSVPDWLKGNSSLSIKISTDRLHLDNYNHTLHGITAPNLCMIFSLCVKKQKCNRLYYISVPHRLHGYRNTDFITKRTMTL